MVHFYNPNDGQSYDFSKEMTEYANKLKGIVTVGFVSCAENKKLCDQEVGTQLPSIVLYPLAPFGKEVIQLEKSGDKNPYEKLIKRIVSKALNFVKGESKVKVQTDETKLGFLKSDSHLPKVLFFGDDDKSPIYLDALSRSFQGKLLFGLFNKNNKETVSQFNIKKFPTLIVYTGEN